MQNTADHGSEQSGRAANTQVITEECREQMSADKGPSNKTTKENKEKMRKIEGNAAIVADWKLWQKHRKRATKIEKERKKASAEEAQCDLHMGVKYCWQVNAR